MIAKFVEEALQIHKHEEGPGHTAIMKLIMIDINSNGKSDNDTTSY
jgi:hypothetical protein